MEGTEMLVSSSPPLNWAGERETEEVGPVQKTPNGPRMVVLDSALSCAGK